MRATYHSDIFFPSDKDELLALASPLDKREEKKAIIVPHQDLRIAAKAYQEAFRYIPNRGRIIALIPLHGEKLLKDEDNIVFEPEEMEIETPIGSLILETLNLDKAEHYAEEEYSAELIMPYVQTSCPNSKLSIVFASVKNAEESKKLAKLIDKWNDENTFFIISSNLTGRLKDKETLNIEKNKAIEALSNGEKLLDSYRKGHISICASPVIDALSRVIDGKWKLIESVEDVTTGHASFFKETK